MIIAHDVFAESNPAFGTFALVGFCQHHIAASYEAPPLCLAYLALPIAMSEDLAHTFDETRATTGLLSWLNRYPDIRLKLGDRFDCSKETVSSTIRFALSTKALTLGKYGAIELGCNMPKMKPVADLPTNSKKVVKRAERLGIWMANAGSAGSIYSAFGVMP